MTGAAALTLALLAGFLAVSFGNSRLAAAPSPTLWEEPVYSVAFAPDGKTVAATYKTRIRLWDVETREPKMDLEGHPGRALSVAITPDGKTLVSGSDGDGATVKVWDLPSGTLRHTLSGHLDGVATVAVSSDSHVAASAGADSIIRLWDLHRGNLTGQLRGHMGVIVSVAFSPDGQTLASAAAREDEQAEGILLWDVRRMVIKSRFAPGRSYSHVAFSPDGALLAVLEEGRAFAWAQVYSVGTGRLVRELGVHGASIAFSPDGNTLGIGRWHQVRLWNLTADQARSIQPGHVKGQTPWVESIAFSRDGRYLAIGSNDVRLWDFRRDRLIGVLR